MKCFNIKQAHTLLLNLCFYALTIRALDMEQCDVGLYFDRSKNQCSECPDRTYGSTSGLLACEKCPSNAVNTGLTKATKFEDCECPEGYYLDNQFLQCVLCPPPGTLHRCPGFHGIEQDVELKGGGWYLSHSMQGSNKSPRWTRSLLYERCRDISHCKGQTDGYRFSNELPNAQCAYGHTGYLCFECSQKWTRLITLNSSSCSSCPQNWECLGRIFIFYIVLLLLLYCFVVRTQETLFFHVAKTPPNHRTFNKFLFCTLHIQLGLCIGGALLNVLVSDDATFFSEKSFMMFYLKLLFHISMILGFPVDMFHLSCLHPIFSRTIAFKSTFILQFQSVFFTYLLFYPMCILFHTLLHTWKVRRNPKTIDGEYVNITMDIWVALSGFNSYTHCTWMALYFYIYATSQLTRYNARRTKFFLVMAPVRSCRGYHRLSFLLMSLGSTYFIPILLPLIVYSVWYRSKSWKVAYVLQTLQEQFGESIPLIYTILRFLLLQFTIIVSMKFIYIGVTAKLTLLLALSIAMFWVTFILLPFASSSDSNKRCETPLNIAYVYRIGNFLDTNIPFQVHALGFSVVSVLFVLLGSLRSWNKTWRNIFIICSALAQWPISFYLILNLFLTECLVVLSAYKNNTEFPKKSLASPISLYAAIQLLLNSKSTSCTKIFSYIERLTFSSPFPAETLAQLQVICQMENILNVSEEELIDYVVMRGHIEPQYASCVKGQRFIRLLFKNVIESQFSQQEYQKVLMDLLESISEDNGLTEKVKQCEWRASEIRVRYTFTSCVTRAEQNKNTIYDILLENTNSKHPKVQRPDGTPSYLFLEELNRTKTEFRYIFPCALPCITFEERYEKEREFKTP